MSTGQQRYRYATAASGALVDVSAITPLERRRHAPFRCLGCGREMIPRLGAVRIKHFAHRRDALCAAETYLHQAAKRLFTAAYDGALRAGRPFVLERRQEIQCTHHERNFDFVCQRSVVDRINLTRYFDRIELEKEHGGFRPDVLLSSSRRSDVLFVEFVVTHPCDPAKLASGIRILQLVIPGENALSGLARCRFPVDYPGLSLHNFRPSRSRDVCRGSCRRAVLALQVYPSQRFAVRIVPITEVTSGHCGRDATLCRVLGCVDEIDDTEAAIRDAVREAHWAGIPVRDCRVCRYHGLNTSRRFPIFCRLLNHECRPMTASTCTYFEGVRSPDDARELDRRNADYQRQRPRRRVWAP